MKYDQNYHKHDNVDIIKGKMLIRTATATEDELKLVMLLKALWHHEIKFYPQEKKILETILYLHSYISSTISNF